MMVYLSNPGRLSNHLITSYSHRIRLLQYLFCPPSNPLESLFLYLLTMFLCKFLGYQGGFAQF